MTTTTQNGKINHYPDWLFYLLIGISLITGYSAFHFSNSSSKLKHALTMTADSLNVEKNYVSELNSRFDVQSQLTIRNSGTTDFAVNRFYVFYFDKKEKKFKSCVGHIEGAVKAGGMCKPQVFDGDNPIWDGGALAYYIEVVSMNNYYSDIKFCKSGSIDSGEPITINADSRSQLIDFPATCN